MLLRYWQYVIGGLDHSPVLLQVLLHLQY